MLILFLLPAFLLSCLAVQTYKSAAGEWSSSRDGLLKGILLFGALLAVVTEGLSALSIVNEVSLSIAWLLITLLLSGLIYKRRKFISVNLPEIKLRTPGHLFLLLVGFILFIPLIVGLLSPPNNWDSQTYHMARVVHWIQNGHLAHYLSHITRQHYQPPFAEMVILHLQILSRR